MGAKGGRVSAEIRTASAGVGKHTESPGGAIAAKLFEKAVATVFRVSHRGTVRGLEPMDSSPPPRASSTPLIIGASWTTVCRSQKGAFAVRRFNWTAGGSSAHLPLLGCGRILRNTGAIRLTPGRAVKATIVRNEHISIRARQYPIPDDSRRIDRAGPTSYCCRVC